MTMLQCMKPLEESGQLVTVGAASARTGNAVAGTTTVVRLVASTDCFVMAGNSTVDATTKSMYLPSGIVEYINVNGGGYIAAIQATAGGTLYVCEMTK